MPWEQEQQRFWHLKKQSLATLGAAAKGCPLAGSPYWKRIVLSSGPNHSYWGNTVGAGAQMDIGFTCMKEEET